MFSISGRGTVVTGRVERGIIKVGEEIEIVGIKDTETTTCRVLRCSASCLMKVVLVRTLVLLRGTKRDEVERGQVRLRRARLRLTLSLKRRCTFCLRTRVVATRHFQGLSSPVLLPYDGRDWQC